ncbi:MAG: O-antigen ligase family protein [Bacteroidota bacterium]
MNMDKTATQNKFSLILYWLLLGQLCIISISIAAASLLLGSVVVLLFAWSITERKSILPRTPYDYVLAAYFAIELVTVLLSEDKSEAFKNVKRFFLVLILYAVVLSFDSRKKTESGIKIISAAIALLSVVEIVLSIYFGIDRLSVFQHYMTTGGLKMIVSLLLIPFILAKETPKRDRLFFVSAVIPIFLSLLLTNTRSSWLGFLAGMAILGGLYYRKLLGGLIGLVVLFFLFAPQNQIDRAKSIVDLEHPNNVGRVKMWTTGIEMWKDKPIFGFGDIDLYRSYSRYRTPGIDEPAGHLHNIYIHLLVTLGIVGFAIVMFLFFKILQTQYRIFVRCRNDALPRNVSLGALSIFTGFLINGLFEWNFGDHEIMVFIWFTVGLCIAINSIAQTEKQ